MNYLFITIMHNLKTDFIMNKGKRLDKITRISNKFDNLNEAFTSKLMQYTLGSHSIDEFKGNDFNTVYYYKTGQFPDTITSKNIDQYGTACTFYLLREAQNFSLDLWFVKDNNIYVRDGFLVAYSKSIPDGSTFKASLTETFKKANGELNSPTIFSDLEISEAIKNFASYDLSNLSLDNLGGKMPDFKHFYKNSKSPRMLKAHYFLLSARQNAAVPMKILFYCTALECLFNTSVSEISYQISERVALLLGESPEQRLEIFNIVKTGYRYRSSVVHGSDLKGDETNASKISNSLDFILRQLLNQNHSIFDEKSTTIDEYFLNKALY